MLRWLIVVVVAVFVIGILQPRLARLLRLGKLPGDLRIHRNGREYVFPFTSTLLLSLLLGLVARLL